VHVSTIICRNMRKHIFRDPLGDHRLLFTTIVHSRTFLVESKIEKLLDETVHGTRHFFNGYDKNNNLLLLKIIVVILLIL
jgi:hypothetical protein